MKIDRRIGRRGSVLCHVADAPSSIVTSEGTMSAPKEIDDFHVPLMCVVCIGTISNHLAYRA